ncbi:MAG: hypothetical protein GXY19_15365 [Phycisphaerae bacterium]|nr:hypothetical protein [Phycisphaerae bacterium]
MERDRSSGYVPKDWQFILGIQLAPVAFLMVGSSLLPVLAGARQGDLTLFWIALASALVGIVLLFIAKWPLYRQGTYLTFGPKALPEPRRKIYRVAYALIGVSLLTTLLLWAAVR